MLRKTPLRKRSKKRQESMKREAEDRDKMQLLFQEVWDSTPPEGRVCYETGKPLLGLPLTIYFHHILEKETFPEYKFCKWNIVLVNWATHDQVHWDIDKCPRIKALREKLLLQHKEGKLNTN